MPDPVRTYRIRPLPDSPVARTGHVAIGLADGSALVMGGNSSEAINVPDSDTTQRFDPTTEAFTAGPLLALSAVDQEFPSLSRSAGVRFSSSAEGLTAEVHSRRTPPR